MAIAELHGKSPLTNSEDFLTADVFGAFRYLPPTRGIIGFLRSIPNVAEIISEPKGRVEHNYYFWPLGLTREPDVLLELSIGGRSYHVVVEAKYLSGPSDQELEEIEYEEEIVQWGNQLADQLRELQVGEYMVYANGRRDRRVVLDSRPEDRFLLYLTADALPPRKILRRSRSLAPGNTPPLFWANWHDVYDYLL